MTDMQYAGLNTFVRIKEQELLSKETIQSLVNMATFEQALQVLKSTVYKDITVDYEQALLNRLITTYQEIYAQSPQPITPLFALVYTYHNTKVLLKMKMANLDLEHLLVPIGQDIAYLKQAVLTGEDAQVSSHLFDAIQSVQAYGELEWVDILLDQAYFKELIAISETFDTQIVDMIRAWIDVYNVNVVKRLIPKKVSRSVLVAVLAEQGHIPLEALESHFLAQDDKGLVTLLSRMPYAQHITALLTQESIDLDLVKDFVSYAYVEQAKLEPFGFLPTLAYLYYVEMEVKNIRLILAGKENDMSHHIVKERVRPSYDL